MNDMASAYYAAGHNSSEVFELELSESNEKEAPALSPLVLACLTLPNLGIQIVWTTLMTWGTPYFTSLGISHSLSAFIWLSAPISGTILQPIFGLLSDRTVSRWGRRKPYIFGGAFSVFVCLLLLSKVRVIAIWTMGGPYVASRNTDLLFEKTSRLITIQCFVYTVGLSIAAQPLQCGIRALVVDCTPSSQQSRSAAWSARFSAIGAVGMSLCGIKIRMMPKTMEEDFQMISASAVLLLMFSIAPVCLVAQTEVDPASYLRPAQNPLFTELKSGLNDLPENIRKLRNADPGPPPKSSSVPAEQCAILVFHSVAFCILLVAPFLPRLTLTASNFPMDIMMEREQSLPPQAGPSWERIWQAAHALFTAVMCLTFLIHSLSGAMVMMSLLGVAWAVTSSVPYILVNTEMSLIEDISPIMYTSLENHSPGPACDRRVRIAYCMGIHNTAISLPQVLAALICGVMYKIFETFGSKDGPVWAFRLSAITSGYAALLTRGLT
ncbi:hypothetical protein OPT61_g2243 [Boeremia exigua]|uniref:Uncharacterized protein n=1 Tax=Boeremia exigua TaxID=749465 RepID=A0ACC2IM75_9PLEO|nr:hypothetical protein OPT61_g2243 [Boeremia exigua]